MSDSTGYVGFANLPNQVHRKSLKKGFEFTLMVVGESGLGKSTLVGTLFQQPDLYSERPYPKVADRISRTIAIEKKTVEIEERGVRLKLTVVDTPGFADAINCNDNFEPIITYVDEQFKKFLEDETGLNRRNITDNRVHCLFYFINPTQHGLKPIDIAFMKAVMHKVNIVPVIAKSDTLTRAEIERLKDRILAEIEEQHIQIYPLPECDSDEDESYKEQCRQMKMAVPFAVVGSTDFLEVKGKKIRGRTYPWGVVEVENPDHCDFVKLRDMLITHMQDLQETTHEFHYENFRADHLQKMNAPVRTNRQSVNVEKLTEKDRELARKEAEIAEMKNMLERMKAQMNQQQGHAV